MVNDCVDHIVPRRERQTLFGFVVPESVEYNAFHTNFCERLVKFGRGKVNIASHLAFARLDTPDIIQRHVNDITTRQKPKLRDGDLVCVVKVYTDKKKKVSEYVQQLWAALQREFGGPGGHNLIVVLFTLVDFPLPKELDIVKLTPPHFRSSDVYNWTMEVEPSLGWGNGFLEEWRTWLLRNSSLGAEDELDVELTYSNLSQSLNLLRNRESLTPAEFLAKLA
jgi:hypothetical protein